MPILTLLLFGDTVRVESQCIKTSRLILPLPTIVRLVGMAICVQPRQETVDAAVRQRYARIGGSVVQIDGVTIACDRVATRKHNVLDISTTFVLRFWSEHPGITS